MDSEKDAKSNSKPNEDTPVPKDDTDDIHGDNERKYHLDDIKIAEPFLSSAKYFSPYPIYKDARLNSIQLYNLYLEVMMEIDKSYDSLPSETRRTVIDGLCLLEQECRRENLYKEDRLVIESVLRDLLLTFDNSLSVTTKIMNLNDYLLMLFEQDIY